MKDDSLNNLRKIYEKYSADVSKSTNSKWLVGHPERHGKIPSFVPWTKSKGNLVHVNYGLDSVDQAKKMIDAENEEGIIFVLFGDDVADKIKYKGE